MSERTSGSRVGERGRLTPGKRDEDRGVCVCVCARARMCVCVRVDVYSIEGELEPRPVPPAKFSKTRACGLSRGSTGVEEGLTLFGAMTLKLARGSFFYVVFVIEPSHCSNEASMRDSRVCTPVRIETRTRVPAHAKITRRMKWKLFRN